jgi:hypothetical protein
MWHCSAMPSAMSAQFVWIQVAPEHVAAYFTRAAL